MACIPPSEFSQVSVARLEESLITANPVPFEVSAGFSASDSELIILESVWEECSECWGCTPVVVGRRSGSDSELLLADDEPEDEVSSSSYSSSEDEDELELVMIEGL